MSGYSLFYLLPLNYVASFSIIAAMHRAEYHVQNGRSKLSIPHSCATVDRHTVFKSRRQAKKINLWAEWCQTITTNGGQQEMPSSISEAH